MRPSMIICVILYQNGSLTLPKIRLEIFCQKVPEDAAGGLYRLLAAGDLRTTAI